MALLRDAEAVRTSTAWDVPKIGRSHMFGLTPGRLEMQGMEYWASWEVQGPDAGDDEELGQLEGASRDDDFFVGREGVVYRGGTECAGGGDVDAGSGFVGGEEDLLCERVLVNGGCGAVLESCLEETGF